MESASAALRLVEAASVATAGAENQQPVARPGRD